MPFAFVPGEPCPGMAGGRGFAAFGKICRIRALATGLPGAAAALDKGGTKSA